MNEQATVTPGEWAPPPKTYMGWYSCSPLYIETQRRSDSVARIPFVAGQSARRNGDTLIICHSVNAVKRLAAHLGVPELELAEKLADGGLVWMAETIDTMVNTVRPLASAHGALASHDYAVEVEKHLAALKGGE